MEKPHLDNDKLHEIRNNTDWRKLFLELGLERDDKKSKSDDWWARSPFSKEKEASFHINEKGFYCFSSKEKGGAHTFVPNAKGVPSGVSAACQ